MSNHVRVDVVVRIRSMLVFILCTDCLRLFQYRYLTWGFGYPSE